MKTYRTLFFGTPDFAVPVLEALIKSPFIDIQAVVTQPDKPVGKKQIVTPPPVKKVALDNNLKVLQPTKIKSGEFVESIKKFNPDVIILIAYGKIITKKLLEIPKHGWLNIHASLLPKYRGASPIQEALLNGEKKTGVTLMKIDEGLDTGPLISQLEIPIVKDENAETLHDKLSQLGADIVTKDLLKYLEKNIKPQVQEKTTTPVCTTINKEDGKINWNKPAIDIERQIRAYTPWPGTYTFWDDKRIKILEVSLSNTTYTANPGQINMRENKLTIGCGQPTPLGINQTILEINKVQLEGKKPNTFQEFIKGHPDFINAKLT